MKPAFISTIMLAATVGFSPWGQTNKSTTQPAQAASSKKSMMSVATSDSQKVPTAANTPAQNRLPWGDGLSQWVIVLITLLTAGFVGWQAWETRKAANATAGSVEAIKTQSGILERQAKASEDAALAAKESADALINIERAWIEAYLSLGSKPHIVETTDSSGNITTTVGLEYDCRNFGKTPAWVTTKQIGMMILSAYTAVPNEMPTTVNFALIGPELVASGGDNPHLGTVSCEGRITKDHPGFVYGKVTYHDIFRGYRFTTFGYLVEEGGKIERLPFVYPTYNQHT